MRLQKLNQMYDEFIDEKDMDEYQKANRVKDYMNKLMDDHKDDDDCSTVFVSSVNYLEREI